MTIRVTVNTSVRSDIKNFYFHTPNFNNKTNIKTETIIPARFFQERQTQLKWDNRGILYCCGLLFCIKITDFQRGIILVILYDLNDTSFAQDFKAN